MNDTYGHDAGDQLIVQFGELLDEHLRSSDFVTRLGGDEFCVIFPSTPLKKAEELAQRLRADQALLDARRAGRARTQTKVA